MLKNYQMFKSDTLEKRLGCWVSFDSWCILCMRYLNMKTSREHTACANKYSEGDIQIIFVEFGGWVFQQTVGIPMGTNCAPLLADLSLYSYEAEFIQRLLQNNKKKWPDRSILHIAISMMFSYWIILRTVNISNKYIYYSALEINETTDSTKSASYVDLFL